MTGIDLVLQLQRSVMEAVEGLRAFKTEGLRWFVNPMSGAMPIAVIKQAQAHTHIRADG